MSTWVLLRGLAREVGHWGGFIEVLSRRLGGARIVALDLPGCGTRHAERSPARLDGLVEASRAALAADGVAPPYRLLGLSLGGMVAAAWSVRHPDDVLGAVLVNSSLGRFAPTGRRLRAATAWRLVKAHAFGDAWEVERAVLAATSRHPPASACALLERWVAIRRERPVSTVNVMRQLWAAAREAGPGEAPPAPLLILAGAGDALVDPECSARIARAWQADLDRHPTAGHDLPLDDPEWVAERIVAWLDREAENDRARERFARGSADRAGPV